MGTIRSIIILIEDKLNNRSLGTEHWAWVEKSTRRQGKELLIYYS